jgi:hypothetical protein
MPRFEFQGQFFFGTQAQREAGVSAAQANFASAAQNYINTHPSIFFGYTPINGDRVDHSLPRQHYQLVQARFVQRTDLDALFAALKTQAQSFGAVAPSNMWLKQVADTGGVTDGLQTSAPAWTDSPIGG